MLQWSGDIMGKSHSLFTSTYLMVNICLMDNILLDTLVICYDNNKIFPLWCEDNLENMIA